jgi:XTP/dITP diphosphohydrolase
MTIILATRNRHKGEEIRAILGLRCLTLQDFPGAPPLLEEGNTFAVNAGSKATQLAEWLTATRALDGSPSPLAVLADDSGLEVDALGGAPGVYSARFAALDAGTSANTSDADNNAKLLRLLERVPLERRTARFRCVLAWGVIGPPGTAWVPRLFDGACEGRIAAAPRGRGGFGYDPLFIPDGFTESFAELGESVKNGLSHRARALAGLRGWLKQNSPLGGPP